MQITGMYWGSKLLNFVGFPTSEVLGPDASADEIKEMIARHGEVFVKPIFKGGVGKKGKAGLLGRAKNLSTALKEKERLYFAEHFHNNTRAKSEGVTYEEAVPSDYEVYFSLTDSTEFRAPMVTITHHGGVAIEELPADKIANIPFDPLTGLKGFVISNALHQLNAPKELVSPLVQNLPKLWDLFHNYGMTTLELNPIRMKLQRNGRLMAVACDFKCAFDDDDPKVKRLACLGLPDDLDTSSYSEFEQEVNQLRTYQGQSDVFVTNEDGKITAMTFGGGASALVTELLGDAATISSDFGGNPPYSKMHDISRIVYKYWLKQSNVLFIIGGKANNTDIYETFRAMADALRYHFNTYGPTPLYVVVGRGGPNLIRGMGCLRDTLDALGLPYQMFGYDSAMSETVNFAVKADRWMEQGGREVVAKKLGIA